MLDTFSSKTRRSPQFCVLNKIAQNLTVEALVDLSNKVRVDRVDECRLQLEMCEERLCFIVFSEVVSRKLNFFDENNSSVFFFFRQMAQQTNFLAAGVVEQNFTNLEVFQAELLLPEKVSGEIHVVSNNIRHVLDLLFCDFLRYVLPNSIFRRFVYLKDNFKVDATTSFARNNSYFKISVKMCSFY